MINRFRGEYEFLSNFYPAKLIYDGIEYYNAESAYQAQKCSDAEQRKAFSSCYSDEAKRKARSIELREDWEDIKLEVMETVVRAKFEQNPRLAKLLLQSGEMRIVEGNTWHDIFWGVDLKTGEGENHLGRILMQLREHFKSCGITDRSAMRPVHEFRPEKRLTITDEVMADINACCLVKEINRKDADYVLPGDVRSGTELHSSAQSTFYVCTPVYGKDDEELLKESYINILNLALKNGVGSIAIPVLGFEKSCFPKKKAAEFAVAAIMDWLKVNPDTGLHIWLVPEDIRIFDYTSAYVGGLKKE